MRPTKRPPKNGLRWPVFAPAKPAYMPSLAITWAKRLKRVFDIDIETCDKCEGDVRIIASIEDPAVIQKILAHLDNTARSAVAALLPDCRASPSRPAGLFD
jgi:hypothetical protein